MGSPRLCAGSHLLRSLRSALLLPPPYLAGISVANQAGFNNKIAALAAGLINSAVFLLCLRWPRTVRREDPIDARPIPNSLIFSCVTVVATGLTLFSALILHSSLRYTDDAGYFIQQISMHVDFSRKLYQQIEFPYGPFLFYGPILVQKLLPRTLTVAYYVTLILEQLAGLLLIVYVLNRLPFSRRWRSFLFLLCVLGTVQPNMGLNYTYLRFVLAPAILIFAHQRRRPWPVAACFVAGEAICLAVSPEMAFAFAAGSIAYAAYSCFFEGRSWIPALVAPILGATGFFLLMDRNYLLMLKLFARGVYNLIVEPLPHILLFLVAIVWLAPVALAHFMRARRSEAPMLLSLYIFSLALLPVAFGRADPGHILFNGLIAFFLSVVALSASSVRRQKIWAGCLAFLFLWMTFINADVYDYEWHRTLFVAVFGAEPVDNRSAVKTLLQTHSLSRTKRLIQFKTPEQPFEIGKLNALVGSAPVATPIEISLSVERALRASGQYTPSFFCYSLKGVLDDSAERRAIDDLNQSQWALLPANFNPTFTDAVHGNGRLKLQLPYRLVRPPYVIGLRWKQNLADHWQIAGTAGDYLVFHQRSSR